MVHISNYEFWFITGSQHLYGPETLEQVARDAEIIAKGLNDSALTPCKVVWKPVVKTAKEIRDVIKAANHDENCAGIITWMHTFSPSKMWIEGLTALQKPYLHVNTQFNRDIPWSTIDMDFMNLNQSAHGDREHGFIGARLRLPRKVIAGYWEDEGFKQRVGDWMRSAVGYVESHKLRVLRISDNMRNVAVTEGDKVEAHIRFGWSVDHYGVGDMIKLVEAVTEEQIDRQMDLYWEHYTIDTDDIEAVRYQGRMQCAIQSFMEREGFGALTTNFEDLQQLEQLPGLAIQDLMRQGYGFGGEGDWKTAAMTRIMKMMCQGLPGDSAFMEDYTYHMEPGNEMILGAHMLEVCPTLASEKPRIQVHPLGIGGRKPPARLVFKARQGDAIVCSVVDMGNRFRMIVNDVQCVEQKFDMPLLPVAGVLWKPLPDFVTSAEAWIIAGGAHHSTISLGLSAGHMRDFAEMFGVEFIHINEETDIVSLKKELRWNEMVY